jgi:hypothetical protein
MRDAGHDGAAAGPKTSGSLTGTAKLTSSSRYADIVGKVRGLDVVLSCDCHSKAVNIRRSGRGTAHHHRSAWPSCLPHQALSKQAGELIRLGTRVRKVRAALAEGDEAEEPAAWTGASEQDPAYQ